MYEEACSTSCQEQCSSSTQYVQQCATATERQCSIQYKQQLAPDLLQPHTETISINRYR